MNHEPAPYPLCMYSDETDGFYWQRDPVESWPDGWTKQQLLENRKQCPEPFRLPSTIFDRLASGRAEMDLVDKGRILNRVYQTKEEAMEDYHRAVKDGEP